MTIDKGIPIPSPKNPLSIYPWHDMAVGDSFLAPPTINERSFRTVVSKINKRSVEHFVVRKMPDGLRVWRDG